MLVFPFPSSAHVIEEQPPLLLSLLFSSLMDDQKSLLSEQRGAHTKKISRRGKVAAYMGNMLLRRIFIFFFGKEIEGLTRLSNKVQTVKRNRKKKKGVFHFMVALSAFRHGDGKKRGNQSRIFFPFQPYLSVPFCPRYLLTVLWAAKQMQSSLRGLFRRDGRVD